MSTVGNTLRLMVAGDDEISTYREGGEQYPGEDPRAREPAARHRRRSASSPCRRDGAAPVRIDNIAQLERGFGPTRITRVNRQFSITFSGDIAPGHALDEASNDVRRLVADLHMPPGYTARLQGQTQNPRRDDDNLIDGDRPREHLRLHGARRAVRELRPADRHHAGAAAVGAVRAVHASGRRAARSISGARSASCCCFGIVKKNSILQVDYTNVLRAQGMPLRAGGRARRAARGCGRF